MTAPGGGRAAADRRPAPPVRLRPVRPADLPLFFAMAHDEVAVRLAGLTPPPGAPDRHRFVARWETLVRPPNVVRTVVAHDGTVVGHTAVHGPPGAREVTYWVDRAHWGRGLATAALRALLDAVPERPLRARTTPGNVGSLRVLRRCGFVTAGPAAGGAERVLVLPPQRGGVRPRPCARRPEAPGRALSPGARRRR